MLLVFVVAAVLSGLSEGSNITRCELQSQLNATASSLVEPAKHFGLSVEDLVAKIVCHAEVSTGFNTSAVKELAVGGEERGPRGGRRHHRSLRGPPREKAGGIPDSGESSNEEQRGKTILYGMFQLSDRLACSDDVTRSLNLCATNCTAFINDDITDDIACLGTIGSIYTGRNFMLRKQLPRMVKQLFPKECYSVTAAVYFAAC